MFVTIRRGLTVLFGLMIAAAPAHAQSLSPNETYVVTRGSGASSMPSPHGGNASLDQHGFRFFCVPSHFSYNDPVVYPGQAGAAHLHMFFGNVAVDANSTSESIVRTGDTSCDGGITNRSAYWIPALFNENDEVVLPSVINNYYKSWVSNRSAIRPIPQGLQILANSNVPGSLGLTVSRDGRQTWGSSIRVYEHGGALTVEIIFPDCVAVDRSGLPILTSRGGTRHVAYSQGQCPRSHPYTIPQLTQIVSWDNIPYGSGWYFSSDAMMNRPKGTTVHADYMAGWTRESAQIMADCVRDGYKECGPGLHAQWRDQFFAPDGSRVYDYFKIADGVDPTPSALRGWPHMLHNH